MSIIIEALQMSEYQYVLMRGDYANLWMERYFGTEQLIIDALNASPTFWKWWNKQWDNRDNEFVKVTGLDMIDLPLDRDTMAITTDLYEEHHNIDQLKIVPNMKVVKEVGALIITETEKLNLIKSQA